MRRVWYLNLLLKALLAFTSSLPDTEEVLKQL